MQDLIFPHPTAPEPGTLTEIAPGVLWLRLALPFLLNHVNIYLVRDGDGWAVIDTGLGDDETRAVWERVIATALGGAPLTRLVVTHYHPDHVGLAGWMTERNAIPLYMSQTEYLLSLSMQLVPDAARRENYRRFYLTHGLSAEAEHEVSGRGHEYLRRTTGLPPSYRRLIAGDTLTLGERRFRVLTGGGHAAEQVMMHDEAGGLFLAADQVIARISPNVSVWAAEPDADALGLYLASLRSIRSAVPPDVLVLPGHQLPFIGLHDRIDALIAHHAQRCAAIAAACREAPRTAAEIVPVIFHRPLDAHQLGFAFGEVMAHVNFMLREGTLVRSGTSDGLERVAAP
jgi:glyoxylase-like metal-dependent hydrolase (beta-lactamase superfamily II)